MIEPKNQQLSISRQCKILDVNRSSYYYRPKPIKQEDLDLMRKIDELYLENPSSGSRTIRRQLKRQGMIVSRKRIQRLMRLIEAVKPYQSQHKTMLRDLTINRPNQVWSSPTDRGFM
jgi:putative transposase